MPQYSKMKVAVDAAPLTLSSGGLRRYTEELTRALAVEFPQDEFHLISDHRFHLPDPPGPPNRIAHSRRPRNFFMRRWWTVGAPVRMWKLGADLFHGTNFEVPNLPWKPAVLTLHDLSPWKDPAWHHAAERVRQTTPRLLGLGLATMVITPTEAVRSEAIEQFHIRPDRIVAIPEAASPHFRPVPPALRAQPYFLYVGTIEPRKNLPVLLEAWRALRGREPVDLILAGRLRSDASPLPPEPGLHVLGEIREEELPSLYSGALAVLYPSLYEGFGLPLLEAMQCGAAVVTTNDPALREVSGGAALHVEATDTRSWVSAMSYLLQRPEERRRRNDLSLARAAMFSWSDTARRTREVYLQAIERFE